LHNHLLLAVMPDVDCAEKDWEAELKKASKAKAGKRRQTKLDKDGNRPDISVYAKAYNKVKAQFTRMRCVILAPSIAPSVLTILYDNTTSLLLLLLSLLQCYYYCY